ncbi:MAG: SRPBCC family protein [Acidimicrobiia bacterium]
MQQDQAPQVERNIEVEAAPGEVWERIVDGRLAEEWLGVVVEPRRGGTVAVPGGNMIGVVEDVDPGRSITWTWRQPDGDPSQVVIDVEARPDGGSRVTVTERLLEYEITTYAPIVLSRAA